MLLGVGLGIGREGVVRIEPEHAGVIYRRFGNGTDMEETMGAGLFLVAPWNKVFMYDLREQLVGVDVNGLSWEGQPSTVCVTVCFRLQQHRLGEFHKVVGPDYVAKVVNPEVIARCRSMLSEFTPNEFEAIAGERIEMIEREIADKLLSYGIVIEAIQFKGFVSAASSESGEWQTDLSEL